MTTKIEAAYGGRYVPDGDPAKAGGMGSVEICTDPHLDRKVAIKFILPGGEKRRIMDEIRALQIIRSKHVVQLYDVVIHQPGNQIGIVQEYLPGQDLSDFWKTPPSPDLFLRTIYQLALGLEDIHAQGQIHRDIKPNNVRLDQENILKIFDFGLSRPNEDIKAQTRGFIGTLGFAAPELHATGFVRFTPAVDVYAFAVTAVRLMTETLPAELLESPPRPDAWVNGGGFATLPVSIPKPIASLLNACLAVEPADRPTMRIMRELIQAHLVAERHRALLTYSGGNYTCDSAHRSVIVQKAPLGKIVIRYDGLGFLVATVEGDVYVNNVVAAVNMRIPESCVLTIGGPLVKTGRLFVTVDISRPEVVL